MEDNKCMEVVLKVLAEKIAALETDLAYYKWRHTQAEEEKTRLAEENMKLHEEHKILRADNARYARVVNAIENYAGEVAAKEVMSAAESPNNGEVVDL